jgi:hypothetical protein
MFGRYATYRLRAPFASTRSTLLTARLVKDRDALNLNPHEAARTVIMSEDVDARASSGSAPPTRPATPTPGADAARAADAAAGSSDAAAESLRSVVASAASSPVVVPMDAPAPAAGSAPLARTDDAGARGATVPPVSPTARADALLQSLSPVRGALVSDLLTRLVGEGALAALAPTPPPRVDWSASDDSPDLVVEDAPSYVPEDLAMQGVEPLDQLHGASTFGDDDIDAGPLETEQFATLGATGKVVRCRVRFLHMS